MAHNTLLVWLGRGIWFSFILLSVLGCYTFLKERHWIGLIKFFVFGLPGLLIIGYLISVATLWQTEFLLVFILLSVISLIVIIIPTRSKPAHTCMADHQQVDERDAFFHRFYRLQPGMTEFDAYYQNHPEQRATDDLIRNLPDLGEPGSRSYHPHHTPMMSSIMSVVNHITRKIDWPAVEQKTAIDATEATKKIKAFAKYLGADRVGTTHLNSAYIYSHIGRAPGEWGSPIALNHSHAIAIAVEMRSDMIAHAPDLPITIETSDAYFTTAKIAMMLARYINLLGYEARAHVDGNYRVMCVPIAVDSGLGELGRLGLLITPQYGPRVRLSVVTTNLPLIQDQPISFGVAHFCTICKKCAENCPSASISRDDKIIVNGVSKWQTQQDSCYKYWRKQGTDCGVCIRVCPYAYPDLPMHRLIRWMVQRNDIARYFAYKGDRFFYGRKPQPATTTPDWLQSL